MENQNQNFNPAPQNMGGKQVPIPGTVAVIVMGGVAIAICWTVIGSIILGIIAMIKAGQATKIYNANPHLYKRGSLSLVKTGKILGLVGIILGPVMILYYILVFSMASHGYSSHYY